MLNSEGLVYLFYRLTSLYLYSLLNTLIIFLKKGH